MSLDKEIFNGKTLSDLFGEIHDNSSTTRNQVKSLINELKPLIDRENVINIQTSFYCFMDDKKELEQDYLTKLIIETTSNSTAKVKE
jgi:hypothetical protein